MVSADSALALELKNELKNGIVGAALTTLALEIGDEGSLLMERVCLRGILVVLMEMVRRSGVRFWKRIRLVRFSSRIDSQSVRVYNRCGNGKCLEGRYRVIRDRTLCHRFTSSCGSNY